MLGDRGVDEIERCLVLDQVGAVGDGGADAMADQAVHEQVGHLRQSVAQRKPKMHVTGRAPAADAEGGPDLGCRSIPWVARPVGALVVTAAPAHQLADRRDALGRGSGFLAGEVRDGPDDLGVAGRSQTIVEHVFEYVMGV